MALRKIIQVEGEAFINSQNGRVTIGLQKTAFSAYCKIINISGNKQQGRATLECSANNNKIIQHFEIPFSVEENAPNFIRQAYVYIKSLPEWANATDC